MNIKFQFWCPVIIALIPVLVYAQVNFEEHVITDNFTAAQVAHAADIDGDEDLDIIGSRPNWLAWWENSGGEDWDRHFEDDIRFGTKRILSFDFNGDDNIDILAGGSSGISWLEYTQDDELIEHEVADHNHLRCYDVYAADIDNDGDIDILSADASEDRISWWENDGNGEEWIEHPVSENFSSAFGVAAEDIDSDGDIDIIGASMGDDKISWFENDGDDEWNEYVVDEEFESARCVYTWDMDGDEDPDIIGGAYDGDEIKWWENRREDNWIGHSICDDYQNPWSIAVEDIDHDGDPDIVAGGVADIFTWWENDDENEDWIEHTLDNDVAIIRSVYTIDIDGDADIDIINTNEGPGEIVLWEQIGTYPGDFNLILPRNRVSVHEDTVLAMWHLSSNEDFNDSIVYMVEWSLDSRFSPDESYADTTSDTLYVFTDLDLLIAGYSGELDELPDDSTIFWRVKAIDKDDQITWANTDSTGWSFNIDVPNPPELFGLSSPANGSNIWELETTLTWTETTDPDPYDSPHYDVWLDTTADLSTAWQVADYEESTRQNIHNLQMNQDYYWTIRATDSNTEGTWASDTFYFNTDENAVTNAGYVEIPSEYSIISIHPNPFNSQLGIIIGLPEPSNLKISVYDILGRKVAIITDIHYSPGYKEITFNAFKLSSGIYFINTCVPGKMNEIQKVVLVR